MSQAEAIFYDSLGFTFFPVLIGWGIIYAVTKRKYTDEDPFKPHYSLIFLLAWPSAIILDFYLVYNGTIPIDGSARFAPPLAMGLFVPYFFAKPQTEGETKKPQIPRPANGKWLAADWVLLVVVILIAVSVVAAIATGQV